MHLFLNSLHAFTFQPVFNYKYFILYKNFFLTMHVTALSEVRINPRIESRDEGSCVTEGWMGSCLSWTMEFNVAGVKWRVWGSCDHRMYSSGGQSSKVMFLWDGTNFAAG